MVSRLRDLVHQENPSLIVPEVEAIATDMLVALEGEGFTVVPTARATQLTMNREGISTIGCRGARAEKLLPIVFAGSEQDYQAAIAAIGLPCVGETDHEFFRQGAEPGKRGWGRFLPPGPMPETPLGVRASG